MKKTEEKRECVAILHNIRSVHNAGSIFRTADAAGISKIYLTGYTPTPVDRFGKERKDFAKTALGAEKNVCWEQCKTDVGAIRKLKKEGYTVIAIEQAKNAEDYKNIKAPEKIAFIIGNEVLGISPSTLALCDAVAEIPMRGKKESLNVSVAAGIAIFRILNV